MSKKIIIFSGLSGSGNTTLIKELIDLNYFILSTINTKNFYSVLDVILKNSSNKKIGVFLNISEDFLKTYEDIKKIYSELYDIDYIQIFLTAQKNILANRYQENRKNHPYIKNINKYATVAQSIEEEIKITETFKEESDYIIDTSVLKPKDLITIFKTYINEKDDFSINLLSFGYKYGLFHYSDYVFDVRFLSNPYYNENLRFKTGEDLEVREFVFSDQDAQEFLNYIVNIIKLIIPRYKEIDKRVLSISFGCTGGQHRSVSFVEELARLLEEDNNESFEINKIHLEKEQGKWE